MYFVMRSHTICWPTGPITGNVTGSCHIRKYQMQNDPVTVVLHVRLAIKWFSLHSPRSYT